MSTAVGGGIGSPSMYDPKSSMMMPLVLAQVVFRRR
jgi:hypothetical protein